MVAVHHEATLSRDILETLYHQIHITCLDGAVHDLCDMIPPFLLGIFVRVGGIVAEFSIQSGYRENILKYHQSQSIHTISSFALPRTI
jgi:hypothetical protein